MYILDPEEVEERKFASARSVNEELQSDFPSLKASLEIPYEGSDQPHQTRCTKWDCSSVATGITSVFTVRSYFTLKINSFMAC
jgi:negative regulator of sigma E activity